MEAASGEGSATKARSNSAALQRVRSSLGSDLRDVSLCVSGAMCCRTLSTPGKRSFRINLPICMNIVHLLRRSFVEALPGIHLARRFVHVVRSANGTNWICGSFVPANAPRNR
jgi:hypothetical protein